MSCWRRLRDWQADGTWLKVHKVLLDELRGADKIDWSRALIDSSFVRAAYGGGETGPSPVDRAKPGTKHHLITDANGIPLHWVEMMRASMRHIVTEFSARRMVIDYFNTAYAPGARRVEQLRLLPDWGG